jgi:DNA polymerase-3 subunit beta
VSLETEENDWLRVEGGFFRGRVAGLPDADFPTQPEAQAGAASVGVPLAVFQQLLARVLFAVTTENTRFSINGALLAVKGGSISLVATDGHRLAHVVRPLSSGATSELSVLVPRKALMELQRLRAADENDELEITASGNHVFFRAGGRVLFSRVLEGSFPNYEKVIPKDNANVAQANRAALAAVISRVSILTSEASRQVSLSAGDGKVVVATSNPAMGEASEELAVTYEGEPVKIGLNSEYLAQFLQVLGAEKVEIRLKNGASQALFVPQGDGPWECQYVVMPMRLG